MPNISYLNVLFIVIDAIVNICQKQVFIHVPPFCLCKPQSSLFATSINKDVMEKNCYGKKVNSLKLFKFFLIVCKIIVVAIVACSIALDVECMPEDQVQSQQKQIINLSYTNKLTHSQVWSAYHISVYQIYRMGGEPLRETERQKSTLMYKHILSYQSNTLDKNSTFHQIYPNYFLLILLNS